MLTQELVCRHPCRLSRDVHAQALEIDVIRLRTQRARLDIPAHVHQRTQWFVCVQGGMSVSIEGKLIGLQAGDSVVVPPGAVRAVWRSGAPPSYFFVFFHERGMRLEDIYGERMTCDQALLPHLHQTVAELERSNQPDSEWLTEALLIRLLIGLRRSTLAARADQEPRRRYVDAGDAIALERLVTQVETFMRRNLHRTLERDEIAAAVNVSVPHLARLFKQATGQSLHQRLTTLRLELAEILLRDSTASVSQIAGEVGFGSFSHFSKLFKAVHGLSPRAWRLAQGSSSCSGL